MEYKRLSIYRVFSGVSGTKEEAAALEHHQPWFSRPNCAVSAVPRSILGEESDLSVVIL
ncbi:hypothetical protein A2U01_0031484, partial [Trifolium medium]|nr:hypothetical protein [Trifolium medium]